MKVKLSDSWKVVGRTIVNGDLASGILEGREGLANLINREGLANLINNPGFIDPISYFHISIVDQGVSVPVNKTISYLIDAGDMYIEQLRKFTPRTCERGTGEISIGISSILVYTAYDKKFTRKSRSSNDINDLFNHAESFPCPGFESRQWKAKLCRSIQSINQNLKWNLCQGVDGQMFLFK